MKPKVIHTRTFYCADDHPIVYYTFDKDNRAMCEYCSTQFVYEPEEKTYSEEMQDKIEPIWILEIKDLDPMSVLGI